MKLFFADQTLWTVREIEGDHWPGKDADGNTCYQNTHFKEEIDAWYCLLRNAEAFVSLSARTLEQARNDVLLCEKLCGDAAIALMKVRDSMPKEVPND